MDPMIPSSYDNLQYGVCSCILSTGNVTNPLLSLTIVMLEITNADYTGKRCFNGMGVIDRVHNKVIYKECRHSTKEKSIEVISEKVELWWKRGKTYPKSTSRAWMYYTGMPVFFQSISIMWMTGINTTVA